MTGHARQRPHILHHQSVALIDMFNFKPPIVFEILKFKHPAISLAESIFAFNSRTRFSQTRGLNRIIKVMMVHNIKPKNLHINGLFLFTKSKKTYFGGVFRHYPLRQFSTLKAP